MQDVQFFQVKWWITFNEPFVFIWVGYGLGVHAPGIGHSPGTIPYNVAHNVLLSHSEAYHIYDQQFRDTQKGRFRQTYACTTRCAVV